MVASSSAVTGFGAAATDRSTKTLAARSRAAFRDRHALAARRDAAHHRAARRGVAAAAAVGGGEHFFTPRGSRVGDLASLTFFHFFESSERCSRKSRYQAFFGVELTARALVKRGYPAVANVA